VSSPTSLDFYDAELRAHHEHLRAAYGISPGDEVLDIGCGTGLTTRDAARAAAPGCVVGVDVSERMLHRARQLTAAERLANVRYERGDAQVHRFGPTRFDVAISRFGTMFFTDPVAAFANIRRALRPGGQLALATWQPLAANQWLTVPGAALLNHTAMPDQASDGPGMFAQSDPGTVTAVLRGARFIKRAIRMKYEPPVADGRPRRTRCLRG
jgi:ubiquinone/menaquinone biosynthesis C-methylase UbiE